MFKIALASLIAAAALTVAGCGADDDANTPSATSAPTSSPATPSASPTVVATQTVKGQFTSKSFDPKVTIVADGWQLIEDVGNAFELTYDGPEGESLIWFLRTGKVVDGTTGQPVDTPADLAVYLREHPKIEVTAEESVTIGGLTGVQLDLATDVAAPFDVLAQPQGSVGFGAHDAARFIVLPSNSGQFVIVIGHPSDPAKFQDALAIAAPVLATVSFD